MKYAGSQILEGATRFPKGTVGKDVTMLPGGVIGRPPLSTGATHLNISWKALPPVKIGDNCIIGANVVIYADVEIGNNSMVCDTACIRERCRIGSYCLIAMGVTMNYNIKMGSHVKVMDNAHLTGNMVIEDRVFIGMMTASANDNFMERSRPIEYKGPIIRKFATIGEGTCLLPGVEIGENAIVGANALVTKDVEPRTVVMGIPAHFVRYLNPEEILK